MIAEAREADSQVPTSSGLAITPVKLWKSEAVAVICSWTQSNLQL